MSLRPAAALALTLLSALSLGAECSEDPGPLPREIDRSDIEPTADGAWLSTPWDIDTIDDVESRGLIEIPPGGRLRLHHGLGRAPTSIHPYVGFSADAVRTMPATGNAAEIWEVTDEIIEIRNGSGGSFFYRFVLR